MKKKTLARPNPTWRQCHLADEVWQSGGLKTDRIIMQAKAALLNTQRQKQKVTNRLKVTALLQTSAELGKISTSSLLWTLFVLELSEILKISR